MLKKILFPGKYMQGAIRHARSETPDFVHFGYEMMNLKKL